MNTINFIDRVKKHFGFLVSEYGYKISSEKNSEIHPQTDGAVKYISDSTVVVIDSDRGAAAVWFYRAKDSGKYYLDPVAIHEYLSTSDKEKELLVSTNPQDHRAASDLFKQKFLLNQQPWKMEGSTNDKLELRLANYASWLKAHASLCLEGNFSLWPKLYEYKIHRARADQLRRGEDELVYTRVKDADGKSKLIKQSMFKDDLEYIEKLKKEFSS